MFINVYEVHEREDVLDDIVEHTNTFPLLCVALSRSLPARSTNVIRPITYREGASQGVSEG